MNSLNLVTVITCLLLILGCSVLAFAAGRMRGLSEGWLECHFKQVAAEKSRRDKLGRFRRKEQA